jgi:beta-phosphoglucomutase-like phosphatase (HAD superfamily)
MTKPSTPDAMVFDLDGTLVYTVETRIAAWLLIVHDFTEQIPLFG